MFGLPLAFAAPWVLLGLALLPAIWYLLRLTPPKPREVSFPPTRLLMDIDEHEETPQRSPWWLTLLRLLLAAVLIIALAGPIWRPAEDIAVGDGLTWILIDNGWTSAKSWNDQISAAERILSLAESDGRPVVLAATADGASQPLTPQAASTTLERLRAIEPKPYVANRRELVVKLQESAAQVAPDSVVWLSDSTHNGDATDAFKSDLERIVGDAEITLLTGLDVPKGLKRLQNDSEALTVTVVRHPQDRLTTASVRVLDLKGLPLGESQAVFDQGALETEARFELPSELRNDIARVEITGENAAGAAQLLDDSWRRRTVGLISGQGSDLDQPLLSPLYYLERALTPFSDLRIPKSADLAEAVSDLLDQRISILVLADVGRLPDSAVVELEDWVSDGGTLLRFAGPRTAGGTDTLIPVDLRAGGRSMGGSLSWKQPQHMADFTADSPFTGLAVPPEVTVNRQVLAEPTADLPDRTWATLEDGTPLVTASDLGRGKIILFHVTADTSWSNLPLSGSFLEMLRRVLSGSNATAATDAETGEQGQLPPLRLLDGYGRFDVPPSNVTPVSTSAFQNASASRRTPPGLYGTEDGFRALNLLTPENTLQPLNGSGWSANVTERGYPASAPVDLRALLFSLAFILLLADAIAVILLAGGLSRLGLRRAGAVSIFLAATAFAFASLSPASNAVAQSSSEELRDLEASLETRLAYVLTGVPEIDDASAAGLQGLSQYLSERTALEPGAPMGVSIATDELAFYSLLYWPIDPNADKPTEKSMARIDTFMRNGGTILFDTRDHLSASSTGFSSTPATLKLREILADLDIPPLEPVPPDHVLTKAFYLLDTFPGRYATSPLWVESLAETNALADRPVRAGDGVSPILITGNDFASAWAIDASGAFMYPTVPNDPVQRDYAFRSGVNIVMYSLTGNYKADQVHIPALLERLGQ
ncbi:putative membrane protein (TIGR02226 family) [Roseibium hamelinense]|uniref:Putative membrane protein (TIGR02226 family) n=1 Tax=Roseibium hamelinense TaxID=150831 RepID=A0A562SXT8_9HYPH|nr:DUF4159 domain-containing protein [Roseibium hamelinense]MTI43587.1 DUF4159 domain-containing protein [Roseibium hamelinense]TWI86102.1 putative membrane protein (TIGR02226 family) [Roseibium hamelinense]